MSHNISENTVLHPYHCIRHVIRTVMLFSATAAIALVTAGSQCLPASAQTTVSAAHSLYEAAPLREETARLSSLPALPYVTADMYDPQYWIGSGEAGDSILASADAIHQTNEAIYNTPAAKMNRLETYDISHHLSSSQVLWLIAVNRCDLRIRPSAQKSSDPGYDTLQESALRVGEPAVATEASSDGLWYHILVGSDSGWVKKTDMAICRSKEEWLHAFQIPEDERLTVTASKFTLSNSQPDARENGLLLTMGTTLRILGSADTSVQDAAGNANSQSATADNPLPAVNSQPAAKGSHILTTYSMPAATKSSTSQQPFYLVSLPARDANGYYENTIGVIAADQGVVEGTPALTTRNLLSTAFHMLGTPYGWGSMSGNEDCSGFVRGVYLVFGYDLPRNTSEQDDIPTCGVTFSGKSEQAREALLDTLPTGTILFQNGHEMMYLGKRGGHYYVINDASSIQRPGGTDKWYIRKVIINTLDQTRHANGVKWINSLTSARVPFLSR